MPAVTNEQVADIIDRALALMNEKGKHWMKGGYKKRDRETGEMSYCSIGALREAAKGQSKARELAVSQLAQEIGYGEDYEYYPWQRQSVEIWNDNPERKWRDVVSAFKRASRKLRKGA